MSMFESALVEEAAFFIDKEVAAYILLAFDRENCEVPEEIQALLDNGQFTARAHLGTLPNGYVGGKDGNWAVDVQEVAEDMIYYASCFTGGIKSLFPERVLPGGVPIDDSVSNTFIVYIPCKRQPACSRRPMSSQSSCWRSSRQFSPTTTSSCPLISIDGPTLSPLKGPIFPNTKTQKRRKHHGGKHEVYPHP